MELNGRKRIKRFQQMITFGNPTVESAQRNIARESKEEIEKSRTYLRDDINELRISSQQDRAKFQAEKKQLEEKLKVCLYRSF
jgi:hypothetical protein